MVCFRSYLVTVYKLLAVGLFSCYYFILEQCIWGAAGPGQLTTLAKSSYTYEVLETGLFLKSMQLLVAFEVATTLDQAVFPEVF